MPRYLRFILVGFTTMVTLASAVPARGSGHHLASWGGNKFDELCYPALVSNEKNGLPKPVTTQVGLTDVAGGTRHSVVVKGNDTVYTCGANAVSGTNESTMTQVATDSSGSPVAYLSGVSDVDAGWGFTVARKDAAGGIDDRAYAWGTNGAGQLGRGDITAPSSSDAATVKIDASGTELPNVKNVAAGRAHGLALKHDGTVWAWGENSDGQLGDGTTTDRSFAVQVKLTDPSPGTPTYLSGVTAIAGGKNHSLAVKSDGTVVAWGGNSEGQLGDATNTGSSLPVAVGSLSGVVSIAAGDFFSLAAKTDGTVSAWGSGAWGQLGLNGQSNPVLDPAAASNAPVSVLGVSDIIRVAAGTGHSLALRTDGTVWAWGWNQWAQLGRGADLPGSTAIPAPVVGLVNVTDMDGGGTQSLAVRG